jgi:predicted lipoprotein with Yx(FWY)xxD motif
MKFLKHMFPITFVLLLALAAAACVQAPTVPPPVTGGSTPATGGSTPATATTSSAPALIHTATATVKGTSKTILTNAQGMTLYYFTPDTPTTSMCTTGCSEIWPALLVTGSSAPTSSAALPGTLAVHTNANGNQVEYNGHFLYTFSGDSAPGQTNGEGIRGKWFVATPDLH